MIKPGSLFSDGAVLQQGLPIPVWGETEPNRAIMAELAGQQVYCRASGSGDFRLRSAGPHPNAAEPSAPRKCRIWNRSAYPEALPARKSGNDTETNGISA